MAITTADIKQLRELTGAGILDCKKALQNVDGDIEQAVEALRKKGLAAASKKASREANDGLVAAKVNSDSSTGAMVELNCETDFVARTDDFQAFADALVEQVLGHAEINNVEALLESTASGDSGKTVSQQLTEMIAKLGENMVINQVARYESGDNSILDSYIHIGGRVGVLVEVSGGSANNDDFVELAHDIALQIAAAAPRYVTSDQVPASEIEAEKDIYRAQIANENKPDNIKERIIEGKLNKWYSEVALVNQEFVKDSGLTIDKLLKQKSKELGSQITIERFARFELGVA